MIFISAIARWHDLIEIAFFSTVIYYFSLWLIGDKQKELLFYFYGYCAATIAAFTFNLPAIASLLFIGSPVITVIFIMLHQETLQRNFITLKNIIPAQKMHTENWIELLIRSCVMAMNNNKELLCVVEQKDSLSHLLRSSFYIDAPLHKGLLDILIESETFESKKIIWIGQNGVLRAINAEWIIPNTDPLIAYDHNEISSWKQEAGLISHKTDALIFKTCPDSRLFDVIVQEKHIEQLNTSMMIKLMKKYQGTIETNKAGGSYVPHHQKDSGSQYHT